MSSNTEKLKKMRIEPRPFVEESLVTHNNTYRAIVKYNHLITDARVLHLVKVEGCIATPISGCNPKDDPWFLVKCKNSYSAEFWLVTDGDKWMFYDRKKDRLSKAIKPNRSVDLNKLNQIDQEILQLAISYYLQDEGRASNVEPQTRKVLSI